MNPLWIVVLFHACAWLGGALFATRLIGWNPKACRRVFLAIGFDILALAINQISDSGRAVGLPLWGPSLAIFGLLPGSPFVRLLAFGASLLLQLAAVSLAIRVFFESCKAAEELRYLQRSGTDRELIKQLDAPRSPRLTSATPTADDDLRDRR